MHSQWQEPQYSPFLVHLSFHCCPHLPLNLPSFSAPNPSHGAISSSVLRCIYYRGLVRECRHRVGVKVTCLCITPSSRPTIPKHSLTLYCLWSCFIMSSYMHIIEACPTQAAWLRWNIWIIYHLQSALPHFRKFSPTKSQNYSCYLHLREREGQTGIKLNRFQLVHADFSPSLFHSYFLSPHFGLIFSHCLLRVLSTLVLSHSRTVRSWST